MAERLPAEDRPEDRLARLVSAYQDELLKLCFPELRDAASGELLLTAFHP